MVRWRRQWQLGQPKVAALPVASCPVRPPCGHSGGSVNQKLLGRHGAVQNSLLAAGTGRRPEVHR